MEAIVPCRSTISDRFPLASFTIRSSEPRYFEVVCATDPRLFHTDFSEQRSQSNFFSSRSSGLLVAERGDTTWIVPSQALRRFAGARRLYYALGTYGGRSGEAPRFSIAPDAIERIPSIGIAGDFTGRSLDRRRIGGVEPPTAAYGGGSTAALRWGGDAALEAERSRSRARVAFGGQYDDGYDPGLWQGQSEPAYDDSDVPSGDEAYGRASRALAEDEATFGPDEYEDGAAFNRRQGEPQYGAARARSEPRYGSVARAASAEPSDEDEYEDGAAYYDASAGSSAAAGSSLGYGARRGNIVPGRRGPAPLPDRAARSASHDARTAAPTRYGLRESVTRALASRGRHADYANEDTEES
jgi:hypothetical protein